MKVLNLYAGIGGNRKLWPDEVEVTAIEINPKIADIYKKFFPNDKVIITDAHQYLLDHFEEFDFIWSSPPCTSHSNVRFAPFQSVEYTVPYKPIYPDMKLYEEVLLLQHYSKSKWVVENVVSFYEPLITPQAVGKHYFWANFKISKTVERDRMHGHTVSTLAKRKGFDLSGEKIAKRTILQNCVEPELGKHIFECAFKNKQLTFGQAFREKRLLEGEK